MIFDDDMYSFIPEEPEDDEEETLEHSSQWVDENGNNTPAYNHKYWIENRDEIMARRRLLKAGANSETGQYTNADADAYLEYLEESVNKYLTENRDRLSQDEQKLLYEEFLKEKERVNSNRVEDNTKKEESKDAEKDSSDSDSKSSKKSSGSSSGSSKSSSSKSGGGSSGSKSGGAVTPGVDPIKGGAKSSSGSKEKSTKEKSGSGKEKSGSGSKSSSDKSAKDNTKNQQPSEDNSPESVAFSKIKETGYEPGSEPTNSYASFIREIREQTSYEVNDAETGLALWKEYRRRRGMDTSDALIAKNRASAEEDISRRQSLKHGLELFEYYSMSPDMRDGYDKFNELMLEHHGIMGMKWGVMNGPPYPLSAGAHNASERKANWEQSLSAAGRKLRGLSADAGKAGRSLAKGAKESGAKFVKSAQNTAAEIRRRKTEREETKRREDQERRESERRSAISSGNRKYADENFNDMSSQEINELLSRADLRAKVDKYNGKEEPKTFTETVNGIVKNIDTYRGWADTGINTWNTFAKLYNSMNDEKLPTIDGDAAKRHKEAEAEERKMRMQAILMDPEAIKRNAKNFTSQEKKDAANALKNQYDLEQALAGNFGKGGVSDERIQEAVEKYIKENGLK